MNLDDTMRANTINNGNNPVQRYPASAWQKWRFKDCSGTSSANSLTINMVNREKTIISPIVWADEFNQESLVSGLRTDSKEITPFLEQ